MILIQGKGVSKGVTNGPIYFFQRPDAKISDAPAASIVEEKARIGEAQEKSIIQLTNLAKKAREEAGDETAILFETHACCHCAYCQRELGHEQAALEALLRTFAYDWPRAEVCCEIGHWFFRKERFRQAAYWYTLALTCARDDRRGGFVSPDCYGYLPCIQLCVRYSRLGDQKKAETFNELAASCKPDSPAVRHNRAVFQALSEQTMQVG